MVPQLHPAFYQQEGCSECKREVVKNRAEGNTQLAVTSLPVYCLPKAVRCLYKKPHVLSLWGKSKENPQVSLFLLYCQF